MSAALKCLQSRQGRVGSVLILVLIVISSMTILSVGLAHRTRIEMKLAEANSRRTQVYYLALGGIERIKALLSQQEELSPSTIARICHFANTAEEEGLFEQLKDCDTTEAKLLTYVLRDEQGYLDINKSNPASWENIDGFCREERAGIVDWIDTDDDTSGDGAETNFYERMEPAYISKNSACTALKELLFVKGICRNAYLGKGLSRSSLTDGEQRDSDSPVLPDKAGENSNLGFVNLFTVYGDEKININTTSRTILAALPGLDEEVADIVLTYQAGPDGQFGTEDDMCLSSAESIAKVEGLTELQIELLKQYCCFDSEYFRVFSYVRLNSTIEYCLMATVKYAEDGPQVLCVERLL